MVINIYKQNYQSTLFINIIILILAYIFPNHHHQRPHQSHPTTLQSRPSPPGIRECVLQRGLLLLLPAAHVCEGAEDANREDLQGHYSQTLQQGAQLNKTNSNIQCILIPLGHIRP